ncbi:hypothetical protein BHE74_00020576 [Ensete ventricosum]|nr:hypothetical protein BHE74_00020576 [Ensete ventricosum]
MELLEIVIQENGKEIISFGDDNPGDGGAGHNDLGKEGATTQKWFCSSILGYVQRIKNEIGPSPDGPHGRSLVAPVDIEVVQPDQGALTGGICLRRLTPARRRTRTAAGGGRVTTGEGRRTQGGAASGEGPAEARRPLAPLVHLRDRRRAGDRGRGSGNGWRKREKP